MVAGQIPVLHAMAAGQAPCNCMLWQVRPLFPPPATACYGGVMCMQHIACSCRLHDLHYSIDLEILNFRSKNGIIPGKDSTSDRRIDIYLAEAQNFLV